MMISDLEDSKIEKRLPYIVMRLDRMGSFHQSRLSFMRVLLRRLKRNNWRFDRPKFDIDENGVGVALYRAIGPERTYTLVAFSHDLPDEKRSDRVIADAWDSTFTLFDGEVTDAEILRLKNNVPLQEAGRISEREFTLSRANKSVRMFDYVKDCLSAGEQPQLAKLLSVGYLMRTTAVYGSGKFGAADREVWADREEFRGSFQPELLSVWLIRAFTIDLVEHLAFAIAPQTAVKLDPDIRRQIGVGNSTGLGMAPFLINHPRLIHAWIDARETALARVRAVQFASDEAIERFSDFVAQAKINVAGWKSEHTFQQQKCQDLEKDLARLQSHFGEMTKTTHFLWNHLYQWAEDHLSLEGQEQVVSLFLELYPDLVDPLAETMRADESALSRIDGSITVGALMELLKRNYAWALDLDFSLKSSVARVWYVSEEKLEPRLGERFEENLEPYEQPLAPGRDAHLLLEKLKLANEKEIVASFLLRHPELRHIVRRVQLVEKLPFGEVFDNTISAEMMPIDLLRCKLSFFGATKFDPRSDRWVRITMYQGAPFPDELEALDPDELAYPLLEC